MRSSFHSLWLVVLALGAALLFSGGCRKSDRAKGAGPVGHPNVVLIVIDTLRADYVGCYGRSPSVTPNLDALASGGVRFTNLYSNSPWTIPSMGSLFTSLYPSECGLGRLPSESLESIWARHVLAIAPDAPTLAEVFADAGYTTVGLTANVYLGPAYEVDVKRGFQHFWGATTPEEETGDVLTRLAVRSLDSRAKEPFFMWLQYMDPHAPYDPPQLPPAALNSDEGRLRRQRMTAYDKQTFSDDEKRRLRELYALEVEYADRQVGLFLDALRQRGFERRTVVAVVSDHGEEFWEHSGVGHGHALFDEQLHVPCIITGPEVPAGAIVETQRQLLDLAPTLATLAGLPTAQSWRGRPLLPATESDSGTQPDTVYAESLRYGEEQRCAQSPQYKWIVNPVSGVAALYDLQADPREERDLTTGQQAAQATPLREALTRWSEAMNEATQAYKAHRPPRAHALSEAELERLKRLGYAQ